ncbi:hypothetical protein CspHIS471_0200960 [Cutaneotrichosporon sp. HIS471]|nr:hypothetical protein CspHIS471_0200960 [Cutaneotrichosporon sp. HIS471]
MLTSLFAILSVLVVPTAAQTILDHTRFVSIHPIAAGRIDPIVSPGKFGGHVHQFYGANNLRNVLNTPAEALKASCTSATISADKSLYWVPMPYFIRPDGKYEPLMPLSSRAYYMMKGNVTPFPPGFRMISGTAMARDESDARVAGLEFAFGCENGHTQRFKLPTGATDPTCSFLKMVVVFPSCGLADQTLDTDNHFDHVAFPIEASGDQSLGDRASMKAFGGDRCPPSHPIKYPIITLEAYFKLTKSQAAAWRAQGSNLILANGDTVGTSLHADFVNGWDDDAQRRLIYDCATQPGNNAEECPSLSEFNRVNDAENCRLAGMIPDEDIGFGKALDKLPGCNERWDTGSKPGCTPRPDPGWVGPNAVLKNAEGDRSEAITVAIDFGGADITTVLPATSGTKFEPWNGQTFWFRDTGTNQGAWINSTAEDITRNLRADNPGANTTPSVFGMSDTRAFEDRTPTSTVGAEAHYVTDISPAPTCTSNGLSDVCK